MKKSLLNLLKSVLFIGFGVLILYLVFRSQSEAYQAQCAIDGTPADECSLLDKVATDFSGANYWWLLLVLLCFCISNLSRSIRWNMLLEQLGHQPRLINAFLTINLGYFANLGVPRLGEVLRPTTMARYEQLPVEQVIGTVAVDRMIDVLSILIVSALAIAIEFDVLWGFLTNTPGIREKLAAFAEWIPGLALAAAIGLGLVWYYRWPLLNSRPGQKLLEILRGFWKGIKTVGRLRRTGWFVFHSINIWVMYFLMTYFCFFSFGPTANLPATAALVTFVFGGWGIVIPSPGGMGTYHFLAQTALTFYGVPPADGFSFANIAFFSIQLGCNVLIGLLAVILLPVINRGYVPGGLSPES